MSEQPEQIEDDDDFDADEIMEEYWGKYPDLDSVWVWLREAGHEIYQRESTARKNGEDDLASYELRNFFAVSCLSVRVAEQVLERIQSEWFAAEEKFVKWSFLVESKS